MMRRWSARGRTRISAFGLALVLAAALPSWSTAAGIGSGLSASTSRVAQILRGPLRAIATGRLSDREQSRALDGFTTTAVDGGTEIAVSIAIDGMVDRQATDRLTYAGARVVNVAPGAVEAYASASSLVSLAQVPGVASIRPIPRPRTEVINPGVTLHGALEWQVAGFDGAGVKVGVIDLGFEGLAARVGNELPTVVHARCYRTVGAFTADIADCANHETHGTAVAETIADMAPGVELFVANPISVLDTLSAIAWMTASGVKVINASWGSGSIFEGPGDGTSPYVYSTYALVDRAVASGALWVNAAGNEGQAGWTGAWIDVDADGALEWSAGDELNTVTLGTGEPIYAAIRWADPWGASANDYSLELLKGDAVVASSDDVQAGAGDPYEMIVFVARTPGTYGLRVRLRGGTPTSRIQLLAHTVSTANLRYQVASGTLSAPADSANPGMVAVGAVNVASPGLVELYSSRGPTLDGRIKPDIVAADCAPTTIVPDFCGTSQAAPFVTGAAALLLQADPSLTSAQLADQLRRRAVPVSSSVPNAISGWGRLSVGSLPATTAANLAFAEPIPGAVVGGPLPGQPVIRIVDSGGATVSTGASSRAIVTLALKGATGAHLVCDDGLSRRAVEGTAYFTGCTIDAPGSGYRIEASTAGLPSVETEPFEILPLGAAMPLIVETPGTTITWSQSIAITGRLTVNGAGSGRLLELERSTDGVHWTEIATETTDSSGQVSVTIRAATSGWYRVCYDGSPDLAAAISYPVFVTVRQKLIFSASIAPPRTISKGRAVAFTATVRPLIAGAPPSDITVVVYRRVESAWVPFKRASVETNAAGRATFRWTFSRPGSWYIRAVVAATGANAASTWSPPARYVVK